MHLIYTPDCKFAQNFDAMLIYDLFSIFSILLFIYGDHACISSILQMVSLLKIVMQCWFILLHHNSTPVCKFARNFDAMLIYDLFLSFCFIYGDHVYISSILQTVSLLKISMQCWFYDFFLSFCFICGDHVCISFIHQQVSLLNILIYDLFLFHMRWPCMHFISTPACKFAQNFDAVLIYDFFLSFCFIYGDHACISSILQHVSLLKILMQCWFMTCFLSFCFIYGDHACISSILQHVSLLKTLMQCWFMTSFYPFVSYTVTMHASHLYSSM